MKKTTKMEWDSILNQEIYIYGAAKTAKDLYHFIIQQGYKGIKGFLVTEGKNNPEQLLGLSVKDIHNFNDKEAHILVPHLGIYKEQISVLLDTLGFKNVYLVGQLITKTMVEERRDISEEIDKAGGINEKEIEIKQRNEQMIEQILNILQEGSPDFGGIMPYQSMELIGLEGIRPTAYRIHEYGLREILKAEHDVLDIGCNSGFLDMSISSLVHSVTGIEYDKNLVKVAELVKNYLNVSNCTFVNGDFNDWYKEINSTYNVIFSFAIHHWLNLSPQEYVTMLNRLLKKHGYICFESHLYGEDMKFDECYKEFQRLGYQTICDKEIDDSGMRTREYLLLQKIYD